MKPVILYYKSGCTLNVNLEGVAKLGLGYAFLGAPQCREFTTQSPSGRPGVMFVDSTRAGEGELPEYRRDEQTWVKMPAQPGRPELWCGYWHAAKPSAADLQRPKFLDSLRVELRDAAKWLVPIVCQYDDGLRQYRSALPSYISFTEDGRPCHGDPVEVYAHLWELVAPIASQKLAKALGQSDDEPAGDAIASAAVELLKTNYTLDLPELALLKLLDDDAADNVVDAASRFHALITWINTERGLQKKSASTLSGSATSAGVAG